MNFRNDKHSDTGDSGLRKALQELFESAPTEIKTIEEVLGERPIILYGAGECSHWFFEIAMKRHGCKPIAVLDINSHQGDTWQGIPCHTPNDYQPDETTLAKARVVVCVGNPAHHAAIETTLRRLGLENIVFLHDIYEIHNPFDLPPLAKQQGWKYFREHREQIMAAFDLLADEESRRVYLHLLKTHMRRKPVQIPQRPRNEQYFPRDVPLARGHSRYVCCGAYDGDTIRTLHATCGKVESIVCFEPEPHIYSRLTTFLGREGNALADQILTWPCAVHGYSGQMPFIPGDGLGSRISHEGSARVQCVTLDQALIKLSPTFISMDIEGVEPEALRGAEALLRKCTPDLGICVYHSVNHAWEIPLHLASLDLGYRFFLRNYTGFAIETVLYASI